MEIRRVSEALLRRQSPILNFLAPSLSRYPAQRNSIASRCLSTTVRLQEQITPKQNIPKSNENTSPGSPTPSSASTKDTVNDILNGALDLDRGSPTSHNQRTSRFKSPAAQAANRAPSEGSSSNDMWDAIKRNPLSRSSPQSANRQSSHFDVNEIFADPKTGGRSASNSSIPPPLINLGPSVGRTVQIDQNKGMDVGRAFKSLEIACSRNKVRADFQRQRFHERPGLKRKRLKSERWRRRFKEGFRGMVKMVNEMRKKGW